MLHPLFFRHIAEAILTVPPSTPVKTGEVTKEVSEEKPFDKDIYRQIVEVSKNIYKLHTKEDIFSIVSSQQLLKVKADLLKQLPSFSSSANRNLFSALCDDNLNSEVQQSAIIEAFRNGANVNVCDDEGMLPLSYARRADHALLLIGMGLDPFLEDCHGANAFFQADSVVVFKALFNKTDRLPKEVLAMRNHCGETPLSSLLSHVEIPSTRRFVADYLIGLGADINVRLGKDQGTLLHRFAAQSSTNKLLYIIGKGASLDCPNLLGETAIHKAIDARRWDNVELLLDRGAALDGESIAAITEAVDRIPMHRKDAEITLRVIAFTLLQRDKFSLAKTTALHFAIVAGLWPKVEQLIASKKVSIHSRDAQGRTPLHVAAEDGQLFSLYLLLKAGADPTAADKSKRPPDGIWCRESIQAILKIFKYESPHNCDKKVEVYIKDRLAEIHKDLKLRISATMKGIDATASLTFEARELGFILETIKEKEKSIKSRI